MATYNITPTLVNCTADKDNVTTIDTDATATLKFYANEGFPFNDYNVIVSGAEDTPTIATDKSYVSVALSNADAAVSIKVEAVIASQNVNDSYVVADGVIYRIFNNRKMCRWNNRWVRVDD